MKADAARRSHLFKRFPDSPNAQSRKNEKHDSKDEKQPKKDLGDSCRSSGDATETQCACKQRNQCKDNGVLQHKCLLFSIAQPLMATRLRQNDMEMLKAGGTLAHQ